MRQFLAKLICLVAAVTILEVPTVLLQSYAWATMLNDRIPEQGLSVALSTTFDGEHPCEHCLAAQDLRRDTQESDEPTGPQQFQLGNLKFIEPSTLGVSTPRAPVATFFPYRDDAVAPSQSIYLSVPTPPPRLS